MDNAGKDGGRVQLHQDVQEDIRKAPFMGTRLACFNSASVFQSTQMGVVRMGEGRGTDKVDMGRG